MMMKMIKDMKKYQEEMFTKLEKKIENGGIRILTVEKKVQELSKAFMAERKKLREGISTKIAVCTEHLGKHFKKILGKGYKPLYPNAAAIAEEDSSTGKWIRCAPVC